MSKSWSAKLTKFLAHLPKNQNLISGLVLAIGLSLGLGILIGEQWAQSRTVKPNYQSKSRVESAVASRSISPASPNKNIGKLTNLNSATFSQLDALPGIGATYAQKIIANRPYQAVSDLLIRKVLPVSTYNKIKDQVGVD